MFADVFYGEALERRLGTLGGTQRGDLGTSGALMITCDLLWLCDFEKRLIFHWFDVGLGKCECIKDSELWKIGI